MDTSNEARRRSYSQLSGFSECSYRFYLQRVLKVPAVQAVWFPGGTAFHASTEVLDRLTFSGETTFGQLSRQKLDDVWSEEFDRAVDEVRAKEPDVTRWRTAGRPSADKPNGEDLDWWRSAGRNMLSGYVAWWVTEPPWKLWALPDGKPALEVPLLVNFGKVPVVGYVDQILRSTDTGRLLIVDKKTGSMKPTNPLQLAGYNVELQAVFGQTFGWGSYFMAREAKLTEPEPLSHWDAAMLTQLYERMDAAERQGLYLPNLGRHCSGCLARKWCPPAGGQEYVEEAA